MERLVKKQYLVFLLFIALSFFVLCSCEKKNAKLSLAEQCVEIEAYILDNQRVTLNCIDEYRYDGRVYIELKYDAFAVGRTMPIDILYVAYDQEDMNLIADLPITANGEGMLEKNLVYYQALQIAREQGTHTHYSKDQFQKFFEEALVRKKEEKEEE